MCLQSAISTTAKQHKGLYWYKFVAKGYTNKAYQKFILMVVHHQDTAFWFILFQTECACVIRAAVSTPNLLIACGTMLHNTHCKVFYPKCTLPSISLDIPLCCWVTLHRVRGLNYKAGFVVEEVTKALIQGFTTYRAWHLMLHTKTAPGLYCLFKFIFFLLAASNVKAISLCFCVPFSS